jgi:hypothetical protein
VTDVHGLLDKIAPLIAGRRVKRPDGAAFSTGQLVGVVESMTLSLADEPKVWIAGGSWCDADRVVPADDAPDPAIVAAERKLNVATQALAAVDEQLKRRVDDLNRANAIIRDMREAVGKLKSYDDARMMLDAAWGRGTNA